MDSRRFQLCGKRDVRRVKPLPNQPGTFAEQVECLLLFWANPARKHDREGAWRLARRLVLQHARAAA